jgi:hypothetical protein
LPLLEQHAAIEKKKKNTDGEGINLRFSFLATFSHLATFFFQNGLKYLFHVFSSNQISLFWG